MLLITILKKKVISCTVVNVIYFMTFSNNIYQKRHDFGKNKCPNYLIQFLSMN